MPNSSIINYNKHTIGTIQPVAVSNLELGAADSQYNKDFLRETSRNIINRIIASLLAVEEFH